MLQPTHKLVGDYHIKVGLGKGVIPSGTKLHAHRETGGQVSHYEVTHGPNSGHKVSRDGTSAMISKISEETQGTKNMISESIQDIVTQAMQGDAQALQSALDIALREKINAALEEKKHDISKNLVGLGEGMKPENQEKFKKGMGDYHSRLKNSPDYSNDEKGALDKASKTKSSGAERRNVTNIVKGQSRNHADNDWRKSDNGKPQFRKHMSGVTSGEKGPSEYEYNKRK